MSKNALRLQSESTKGRKLEVPSTPVAYTMRIDLEQSSKPQPPSKHASSSLSTRMFVTSLVRDVNRASKRCAIFFNVLSMQVLRHRQAKI